jgi:hypothetical protein
MASLMQGDLAPFSVATSCGDERAYGPIHVRRHGQCGVRQGWWRKDGTRIESRNAKQIPDNSCLFIAHDAI